MLISQTLVAKDRIFREIDFNAIISFDECGLQYDRNHIEDS